MTVKVRIILFSILVVLLLPLWMWLAWLFTPRKKLVIAIIDKTEISRDGQEHVSLNWVLNHQRFTKTGSAGYNLSSDYFGFFPLAKERFKLKGLEQFSDQQIEQLSNDCNVIYFTDTYGVFSNEWYKGRNIAERSPIVYGGMSKEDIWMLTKMKAKHKLIITEFNSIGSPTTTDIRGHFQDLFSLKWSGWIGRYFESLDTASGQLPRWLINDYLNQNDQSWPFSKSGIAFVNNSDQVVILETGSQLDNAVPQIITTAKAQTIYHLPEKIKYSFWFDVMNYDKQVNQELAHFEIGANENGKKLLAAHDIPVNFPAVVTHNGSDYNFYYFCADFCDNPVSISTSYFKGISLFQSFFYDESVPAERESFFWKYYRPLLSTILTQEYEQEQRKH